MRLRNASGGWFSPDYIDLMIVGDSRRIRPSHFESASVAATDAKGKECPHRVEIIETKMGPAISLVVDGRSATERIALSGTLVYNKTTYSLDAMWRKEGDEIRPWRLISCDIAPADLVDDAG